MRDTDAVLVRFLAYTREISDLAYSWDTDRDGETDRLGIGDKVE